MPKRHRQKTIRLCFFGTLWTVLIPCLLFAQTEDPAALLRVFAPDFSQIPHEQAWFQFNTAGHTAPIRAIRFAQDSKFLYSTGEDKTVRVWNIHTQQEIRCVRWRSGRENWGLIHTLAQYGDNLVFAGQSANTWTQELWMVNAKTGEYQTILRPTGPGDAVAAVAFLGTEDNLASLQFNGTVEIWKKNTGKDTLDWKKTAIPHSPDDGQRNTNTLVFFDGKYLVYPVVKDISNNYHRFHLVFYHVETGRKYVNPHAFEGVVALATDANGNVLLAVDTLNRMYAWTAATYTQPPKLIHQYTSARSQTDVSATSRTSTAIANPITSLAISANGDRFIVGTARDVTNSTVSPSYLYQWERTSADLLSWRETKTVSLPVNVIACDISSDGSRIACSQNANVTLLNWDSVNRPPDILSSCVQPVDRVAFAADGSYRIAWAKRPDFQVNPRTAIPLTNTFDPRQIQIEPLDTFDTRTWQPLHGLNVPNAWSLRLSEKGGIRQYLIFRGNESVEYTSLPMDPMRHPPPSHSLHIQVIGQEVRRTVERTVWFLPDAAGRVQYVIMGTSGDSKDIFIFRIHPRECVLVRRLRGHSAATTSFSVSKDRRYLVSSALDGTIRFWNLQGLENESPTEQRWGMTLTRQDTAVVVEKITEDSPLFIRGVREGCRLKRIMVSGTVQEAKQSRYIEEPNEMLANIAAADWNAQVGYEFETPNGTDTPSVAIPAFAVSPTRREVAALAVFDGTSDFAFWTPFGYYTASADGAKFFGWLYNRGLRGIPEFIRADSFSNTLEKRPLMMRLLDAGSLAVAMQKWSQEMLEHEAVRPQPAVVQSTTPSYDTLQQALNVSIEILRPKQDDVISTKTISVETLAYFPKGEKPASPKLFVGGIFAGQPSRCTDETPPGEANLRSIRCVWDSVRLPSDPYIPIKVYMENSQQTCNKQATTLAVRHGVTPPPRPKLYLTLLGTDYTHSSDTDTTGSGGAFGTLPGVRNAIEDVKKTVETASGLIYDVEVFQLLNEEATLPKWRDHVNTLLTEKSSVIVPDDIFVLYVAGHGALEPRSGQYYFAMFDTKFDDYVNYKMDTALSLRDISPLVAIPCRRIVMLETCQLSEHTLTLQDMSNPYRQFETDQFVLMLAAEPGKSAKWIKNSSTGRFTEPLLAGWRGAADGFGKDDKRAMDHKKDGKVTLLETLYCLEEGMKKLSSPRDLQKAVVFGRDLLCDIDIPLSEYECPVQTRGVRTIVSPRPPLGNIVEPSDP